MAKRTTFLAIDPSGKTHTRTSDARWYTNTVVVQHSKAAAIAAVDTKANRDFWARRYAYEVAKAAGTHEYVTNLPSRATYHVSYSDEVVAAAIERQKERNAREIEASKVFLATHPSVDSYVAAMIASALAAIEATDFTIWHNLGWQGRPDLARKLAAKTPGAVILEAVAR